MSIRGFIKVKVGSGKKAIIRFEVLSINRPILSVARLRERGYTVNFGEKLYLEREGVKETLIEIDNMFYLPVEMLPNPDEEVKGSVIGSGWRRSGRVEKIVEEEEETFQIDRVEKGEQQEVAERCFDEDLVTPVKNDKPTEVAMVGHRKTMH